MYRLSWTTLSKQNKYAKTLINNNALFTKLDLICAAVVMILNMDPGLNRIFKTDSNSPSSTSTNVFDVPQNGMCRTISFTLKVDFYYSLTILVQK